MCHHDRGEREINDEYIESRIRQEVNILCKKLADYKRVKVISIRQEEFPKTTTRKIKRFLFKNGKELKQEDIEAQKGAATVGVKTTG